MPRSISEIRKANGGLDNLSDEEIVQSTYPDFSSYYQSPDEYAKAIGYGGAGRSLAGSRVSAGIDEYQSNLYGAVGAVARGAGAPAGVSEWADRGRDRNKRSAEYAQERSRELGGVEDWRDIDGVGSGLNYVGGLAAQSLPYAGEAIIGGLTGGVGFAGTAARVGLTQAAARAAARVGGATVASYPSAVGDILSNQRDQNGTEDMASAAAGGVPYSLLNAGLGVEGRLARGTLARNSVKALDEIPGARGYAARTGATVGRVALGEGLSETGQELINQGFGRMAVDDQETMFNDEANKRYVDSFVGGAALGGVFGGATGGRRSAGYERPSAPSASEDLLELAPRGQAPIVQARAPFDPAFDPLWETSPGARVAPDGVLQFERDVPTGNMTLYAPTDTTTPDMFGGPSRVPPQAEEPEFALEAPGSMADAGQRELDLVPPEDQTQLPVLPTGRQKGVTQQLPFSANTTSPKGQVLQGFVESLAAEGHLDESSKVQVSTLIAQGKFASAKKIVDVAVQEKAAADRMVEQAAKIQEKAEKAATKEQTDATATTEPAAASPQPAVAVGRNKRGAANGVVARADAAPAATPGAVQPGEQGSAAGPAGAEPVPALIEPAAVQANESDDAAIQAVEDAKDEAEYKAAIDELYKLWMDINAEHPVIDEYLDREIGTKPTQRAFSAEWAEAEARVEAANREGKRGLKVGKAASTQSAVTKETDDALRGLAMPRMNSTEVETDTLVKAAARNPDTVANEKAIPDGVVFKDGQSAARWLARNASTPALRLLMARLLPYLKNVEVTVFNPGDTGPSDIMGYLNGTARALAVRVRSTGKTSIYVRGYDGNTEVVWAHELVHAATIAALTNKDNRVPFDQLARRVRISLGQAAGDFDSNAEAYAFFSGQFRDADEFLAYSMTSPTFAEIMKKLDANGNWIVPAEKEALNPVPQMTLWQKFVDMVRALFNLPKVYASEIEKVLSLNAEIEARNANPAKPPSLEKEILSLLDDLLRSAPPPGVRAQPQSAEQTEARASGDTDGDVDSGLTDEVKASSTVSPAEPAPTTVKAASEQASNFITDWLKDPARKGLVNFAFTNDLARMAAKLLPAAQKYVDLMNQRAAVKTRYERKVDKILQMYDALPERSRGTGVGSVNEFLRDSTTSGKWGYVPTHIQDVKADPAMAAKFRALPAQAQALVKEVFEHGSETLAAMKSAVMDNISSDYDLLISEAEAAGDTQEVDELRTKKIASLDDYNRLMALQDNNPYTPLKRFGNFVVVGRSQQLIDAEKDLDHKLVQKLQRDGKHYFVQFAETAREAKAIARDNAGKYALVQPFEKDDQQDTLYGGRDVLGAFHRLRTIATDSDSVTGGAGSRAVNRLVNDLHLTLLSEQSARQAERHRKNIAGADKDMMRAFATQGRATAQFIAALHNNGEIYDQLKAMKKEADAPTAGRFERREYYNEFLKRHAMGLDYKTSPLLDKAAATTSVWMLLSNPAYYLQNATQPLMMSLPAVAGKHGYGRSWGAFTKAYGELSALLRKGGLNEDTYAKLPGDVRAAIENLVDRGRIDITMDQDLGRWRSTEDSKLQAFGSAVEKLRKVATDVETINRVVTAVAAYRLERASGASEAKAIDYADRMIYDTHGDYSGFNAPRVTRTAVGRLATQFRKFQLIQLSLMVKLTKQAFDGATPEERAAGRASLAFTLSHLLAMGGVMALPGFTAIAWVLGKVFGDDDEPDNPELDLRRLIGNDDLADLLLKGAPKLAGVDLSGKLGAGQMLSVLPYTDVDLSREGFARMATALMGPFIGGLGPKAADGIGRIAEGEYYRGLETMMPTGLANAMKGVRLATQGDTQRNGDTTLNAEEVSVLDGALTSLGLPTNTVTDKQFLQGAKYQYDTFFREKSRGILKEYARAYKTGDGEGLAEARKEWAELQEARQRNGFDRQPLSTLLRAPRAQSDREKRTLGGVQYRKDARGFVEGTSEL